MQVTLPRPKSKWLDDVLNGVEHQKIHVPQRKEWYAVIRNSIEKERRYLKQRGYTVEEYSNYNDIIKISWE